MPHPLDQNTGVTRARIDAIKLDHPQVGDAGQNCTYFIAEIRNSSDKRLMRRRRTRLRSGKVLDPRNAFLIECQIFDRSEKGARIRLVEDIWAPGNIRLYEDAPQTLIDAIVVWRKDREIGLCFNPCARSRGITKAQLTCLRGRYYAV